MENARYILDFRLMPELISQHGAVFIQCCLEEREQHLADLFNRFFHEMAKDTSITYQASDFKLHGYRLSDTARVIYIELPREHGDSNVYCTAYAIAYTQLPKAVPERIVLLTVEESIAGTTCIGSMTHDGTHSNFGTASSDIEENVLRIRKIYCT